MEKDKKKDDDLYNIEKYSNLVYDDFKKII